MGNCQAIDAAALVIQHPSGRVDKFYRPVSAAEVMKMNPGHYVALLISTTFYHHSTSTDISSSDNDKSVRFTKIKLLRPTDTLVLGQVYKLVTTQEVMKGLKARRHAKMKKTDLQQSAGKPEIESERSEPEKESKVSRHERHGQRSSSSSSSSSSSNPVPARSKTWQPSLQSILEAGSGS